MEGGEGESGVLVVGKARIGALVLRIRGLMVITLDVSHRPHGGGKSGIIAII
jgi:hypothetical protein